MPRVVVFLVIAGFAAQAQINTGSMTGAIQDPSGLPMPGVEITVTASRTGLARTAVTEESGSWVLTGLEAGEYDVSASRSGFKRATLRGLNLSSSERLPIRTLVLEVGSTTESVTVRAEAAAVQTQSADRSGLVTTAQIDSLLIQGRNPTALVGLMPGVVVLGETQSLARDTTFSVMGNRRTANNVAIDGVPTVDIDNGFSQKLNVNMDAVAEVQVLLSNYQAEYGRNSGSNVNIITKSGSRDFHGLASYFKRHEQFNANNFFNNFVGLEKPRYRYNTWTYNIGGPLYIPGKFNRNRDKLFFFWSQEFWPIRQSVTRTVTAPTALERQGNFSQSRDVNNALIAARDPTTNQPFPGNVIPQNRLNPSGTALLRLFDEPNFFDRNISRGNYNYVFTSENNEPKRSDLLRMDLNLTPQDQVYVTYTGFNEVSEGHVGTTGAQANWRQMRLRFAAPNKGLSGRYTRILSPAAVNEFQAGWLRNPEKHTVEDSELARNQRDTTGFAAGQFHPENNPLKIIPNATFGGVPNAATLAINGRFPADNRYDVLNFTNKTSLIRGPHTFKAGIYYEWIRRDVNQGVAFNGSFDFGRNVNNPLDTGYAWSNAALGVFNSYTEPSARPRLYGRTQTLEWFVQDNWKATSRLTLDYGLRFYFIPPTYDANNGIAGFAPERFDPARAVKLISPGLDARGQRVGVHPVTREMYPAALIGAIAPGTGDTANGLVVAGQNGVPRGLMDNRSIHLAPRFGFAYDVSGTGRTAVRGGLGMFYNRLNASAVLPMAAQPPLAETPVINFGQISTLLSSAGMLFPSNVLGFDRQGKVPTVMNFSLSVQQNIGYGVIVDAGYAGSLGRHLYWQRDANPIPLGANFDPANADPTVRGRPLPPSFLRPLQGHNNINITEPAGSSNYHSLQVTANRRFTRSLQLGAAWTWSKSMDYNSVDSESVSSLVPLRIWNYGLSSFDRTHVVKLNWLYDVPSTPWKRGALNAVLNGWQTSGIASFVSGAPLGIGVTTVTATDITGTPSQGIRTDITGDPVLPKSERTFYRNFRTEVFRMPVTGTFGNAARTVIRGPAINNFDIAAFKNFQIRESIKLQFRAETYNTFNHTQFQGLDTTARFDAAGRQVNGQFGQFTSARDPRQIQFALRLYF